MRTRRGFVLVCVLWVLAILTVVTMGYGRRAMLDRRAAAYALDHTQAMMMARAAVHRGMWELAVKQTISSATTPEGMEVTHLGQPWARPINLLEEPGLLEVNQKENKNDIVRCSIIDLDRFININAADEKFLGNVKSLSRTAIRKIMARRFGKEEGLEGPSFFQTIEELKSLGGVDEKDWYGRKGRVGLKDLLTTRGDQLVNINTAPEEVLACIPGMRRPAIESILRFRAGPDGVLNTSDDGFMETRLSWVGTGNITEGDASVIETYCKFTSGFYKITGTATRRNGTVYAVCSATTNASGLLCAWQEETLGS